MLKDQRSIRSVKTDRDALKDPMTGMFVCLNVSNEDTSYSHSIFTILGNVNGSLQSVSKLKLIGHNGNDLHEWKFFYQLLGALIVQAIFLSIPARSFKIEALDVGSVLELLLDAVGVLFFSEHSVHYSLI
jgi:hypothetical protein